MFLNLDKHDRKYNLSFNDCAFSLLTGFSGVPFVKRYLELPQGDSSKVVWGHRMVVLLLACPVVGGMVGLLVKISVVIHSRFFLQQPESAKPLDPSKIQLLNEDIPKSEIPKEPELFISWKGRALSIDQAMQKMWKNSHKAYEEHKKEIELPIYEDVPSLEALYHYTPEKDLNISHSASELQGSRASMEDAHFFKEIEQGVVMGVFDGHGGADVAKFACEEFKKKFSKILVHAEGNVHRAFEILFDLVHSEVAAKQEWLTQGSTAVVCFIDKKSHKIYTATLGDSEANIYRNDHSLPLSCVRDWSSQKDANRAAVALNRPEIANEWPVTINAKGLRFPTRFPGVGVNVSRAIGDQDYAFIRGNPGVIHKPKITINLIKPGDILILACDGSKDFVAENEVFPILESGDPEKIATELASFAYNTKYSMDNITVVAVKVT